MIRIAVCDDELTFLKDVGIAVKNYMDKQKIECSIIEFHSGKDFIALEDGVLEYDIVFLDINMQEVDGIQTAQYIRQYSQNIYIVFVTAYVSYALEGYKVNAVRYLLKNDRNLDPQINECMDEILDRMKYTGMKVKYRFTKGEKELDLDKIMYIESHAHKLAFHVEGIDESECWIYDRLDKIEEELKKYHFLRIHQSYLVNAKYIQSIKDRDVELKDKSRLPVSRERYSDVQRRYIFLRGEI